MILNKDNIFSFKHEVFEVEVPKWGGVVCVRPLTAGAKDKQEQLQVSKSADHSVRAFYLMHSVCDKDGTLLFSDDDVERIAGLDLESVDIVMSKILEVNGVSEEEIDEMVKN